MGSRVEEENCLKQEQMAAVIIGGCDHQKTVKQSEVWSPEPGMAVPSTPISSCAKPASVFINGSIILCGGEGRNTTPCYSHKLGTTTWEAFPHLSVHRDRFTLSAVGDAIVVVGGFKSGSDVEIFKDGAWTAGPNLRTGHGTIHHCAVG